MSRVLRFTLWSVGLLAVVLGATLFWVESQLRPEPLGARVKGLLADAKIKGGIARVEAAGTIVMVRSLAVRIGSRDNRFTVRMLNRSDAAQAVALLVGGGDFTGFGADAKALGLFEIRMQSLREIVQRLS